MNKAKKAVVKKNSNLVVFSRHPSHSALRRVAMKLPVATSIRFGSTTTGKRKYGVELNKPAGVRISSNKLLMKQKFDEAGVRTTDWYIYQQGNFVRQGGAKAIIPIAELPYPIIAKNLFGSRGRGNYKLDNLQALQTFINGKDLNNYIFEKYYNYSREYRLHITTRGCFYTCRKMLKEGTPEAEKWHRHDDNCVWILESNPQFNKPSTWNRIVEDCVKALNVIGLDFAAFDVKVQTKEPNDYIILESNSAPSFGEETLRRYVEEIPNLVNYLINNK